MRRLFVVRRFDHLKVGQEARFALQRSTLVPANLDRSEPPLEFRFLESAQLHAWHGATDDSEFSVLSEGIAQHVKPARGESNVEPAVTLTAARRREIGRTVPASTPDAPGVDEAPRVVGSGVRSQIGDYAPESAPRQSWPSRLRKQSIPIASAAVVLVVTASFYWSTRTGPQVTDTSAPTPADTTTPAVGSPSSAVSPTPRPVPFGKPVRFRTDMWSLPDEPLLGFVEIPAGQFTMGSDRRQDPDARDAELPQHKVDLPRYYIGRYAVTVAQFRAFVQASGYLTRTPQEEDQQADPPVVNVSWHDAVAYATRLDTSLRESRTTPAGVRSNPPPTARGPGRTTRASSSGFVWRCPVRALDPLISEFSGL